MTAPLTTISACVIARDAAPDLAELLPSLRWADEVFVLVDDATTDESREVAAPLADRVERRRFASFSQFRNLALELARCPWVLFVDADERVSPALAREVAAAVHSSATARARGEDAPVGYWIPRHNIIFGRLVRGGGWSPDYQLRLMQRNRAHYDEARLVHETSQLNGPDARLDERLLHLNYGSPAEFIRRQRRYTELEAAALRRQGKRFRTRALIGQPLREFGRRYVTLGGWKDGPVGLFLSATLAYYAFKRVRLSREAFRPEL